jgi:DNA replication licensing factor MCM2
MAIRVMLESFISTQKVAVVQRLQARLSRFLTYKKDHNELLLHVLNQAFTEHMQYLQARRGAVPDHIELQKEDFEAQVYPPRL